MSQALASNASYPALAVGEKGHDFTGFRLCACCKIRESRGLGWFDVKLPIGNRVYHWACSPRCQEVIMNRNGQDQPLTEQERAAVDHAGQEAGAYLEALGKTDLAQMEFDEWMEFIQGVCLSFADYVRERAQNEDIPH